MKKMNEAEYATVCEGGGVSRRDLLKGAAVGALGIGAMSVLGACTPSAEGETSNGLTPGIYEATAPGLMGETTVHVTVDKTSIVDIEVVSCTDMPSMLSGVAVEQMPARILEAQSTMVDTVAGATMTSFAIRQAVTDALAQAGGSRGFDAAVEPVERTQGEDVTVDVLVVGGGGSGIMAALEAKYADFDGKDSGLDVMLIEKLSYVGGSAMLSGGSCRIAVPLDDNSYTDDLAYMQPLYDFMQSRNSAPLNEPLLHAMWNISGDTIIKMERLGMPYVTVDAYNDIESYTSNPQIMNRITPPRAANHIWRTQTEKVWLHGGVQIQEFFEKYLPESGIDIRLNTAANELIVEGGAVVGVRVTGPESTYNVYAQKTILATGGFARNEELILKYAPAYEGIIPFVNPGATGDGILMCEGLGAEIVGDGMMAYIGTDARFGMWADFGAPYHGGTGTVVFVNADGRRFVRDSAGYDLYRVVEGISQQEVKKAWAIIDSENPAAEMTENSAMTEYKWKADTIEELADMIGVPADNLAATIDAYNAAYDAGEDAEFETAHENMLPVRTAPFYAVVCNPIAIGSLAGVRVNENCEVLVNDEPVPNLYTCGEMVFGGNICTVYLGALSNATAFYTGRIAAMQAKGAILGA